MPAEVVVPFLGGCPHRERALAWLSGRLELTLAQGAEPWCKARAAMPAIEASSAEIIVIHDADVWSDGLGEAIGAVEEGAPWAMPHGLVHRLDSDATQAVLAGAEPNPRMRLAREAYRGIFGGGVVVALREVLLDCPLDPRFVGWGQEDESHAAALRTIGGNPWRGKADLYHCFHPPQERLSRRWGSIESRRLRRRYANARRRPDRMRALLSEAKELLDVDRRDAEHPLHDHPAHAGG